MTTIYLTHGPRAFSLYYGDRALEQLGTMGEILRNPLDHDPDGDALVAQAKDADIIVAFRIPALSAQVLDRLPRTRAVCRVAVDVRNIDVEAASRNGILVTHATPGFATSVSEWIIGVMLDLSRGVTNAALAYRQGEEPAILMGRELRGSELGLIGYGTIGRQLVRLALVFGMKVRVYDPYVTIDQESVQQSDFGEVLSQSDYVVCLAPATPQTEHLIDRAALAAMRTSAFFINASRGELVDEAALADALDSGRIAACALDVGMAPDERPSRALARHPRVIATPHIGGLTVPAVEHQAMDTVGQVRAILNGQIPDGALNAAQAHRLARPLSQRRT